ncbi:barstar family protein [Streptomyces johnsoniae]|uniref:Barstar family protein n=1 Tax=Streptomyces johnsoniae TaxID=3075532 RepID=A0ABU2S733_9ACTN|nr:barstar family protein [Streptomyces sp. DSM 41886]MDT0444786.1 barstar family protein [Streptomyces sp. DSM 41886]
MSSHRDLPEGAVARILDGTTPPGVYRWPGAGRGDAAADAVRLAARAHWHAAVLPLADVTDKFSFLDACAEALELPDWFGRNWDALQDCLTDLSWWGAPRGYLLIATGWEVLMRTAPDVGAAARPVVEEAVTHWRTRRIPMTVLLDQE